MGYNCIIDSSRDDPFDELLNVCVGDVSAGQVIIKQ